VGLLAELRGVRFGNGYGSHTLLWINGGGEKFWVKYHFKTDQGIGFLTQAEADHLAGADGDYHRRDRVRGDQERQPPRWTSRCR
jgi:catalase